MLNIRRRASLLLAAGAIILVSCTPAVTVPAVVCVGEATTYLDWLNGDTQPDVQDEITEPADTTGDLLGIVQERGTLKISTDSDYAPQSFLNENGDFEGFDIDVGTEIADRLGVAVEFQHVDWDLITAGAGPSAGTSAWDR